MLGTRWDLALIPCFFLLFSIPFFVTIEAGSSDLWRQAGHFSSLSSIRFHFHSLHLHCMVPAGWGKQNLLFTVSSIKQTPSSGSLSFCIPVLRTGEKRVKGNYNLCESSSENKHPVPYWTKYTNVYSCLCFSQLEETTYTPCFIGQLQPN